MHEQATVVRTFEMVLARSGPRLRAAVAKSTLPAGMKLPGGGVTMGKPMADRKTVWDCHGATMQDLAWYLSRVSQTIPVRDKTGLSGRYDFTLEEVGRATDDERVYSYPVDHLGLKLRPGTENRPNLVVDHIENPTAN